MVRDLDQEARAEVEAALNYRPGPDTPAGVVVPPGFDQESLQRSAMGFMHMVRGGG